MSVGVELRRLMKEQLLISGMNSSNLSSLVFVLVFFPDTLFDCEMHVMVKIWLYFCTVVFSLIKGQLLLFVSSCIFIEVDNSRASVKQPSLRIMPFDAGTSA